MRLLAIAWVILHIGRLHAAPAETVVVAVHDPALIAVLGDALAPSQVITAEDPAPTAIGELTAASRRIVERENASAAIWLISDGGVTTLVAYDRGADRVLVRTVPYATPLDDAQAAVTARSARAMLRALSVEYEVQPQPRPTPAVVVDKQLEPTPPQLATTTHIAARFGAPGATGIPELTLGAIWRPHSIGLAVDLTLAVASDLEGTTFKGSIGDRSIGFGARVPFALTTTTAFALNAGVAVHAIRFAGETPMRTIVDWRFDPAIRVGTVASYALRDGIEVGLALSADYLLRRQKYEVEGNEIVVMSQFQLATGLVLTIWVL